MKQIKRLIIYACLAAAMLMAGCTANFKEYNTNPYRPSAVPPSTNLSTMFGVYANPNQNDCQYCNCMWACFSGQITNTYDWGFGKNNFGWYNATNDHNDAVWGRYYSKIYPAFFLIENSTGGQGVVYAIAKLTKVYAMHVMLSLQGPIPYTMITEGETEAPYDDEQTAWHALFDDLDDVISELKISEGINPDLAEVDQFYSGDPAKWLKFANTLKLRMAIRISGVEPDFARQKAEEAVSDGVMESVGDSSYDTTSSGIRKNGYSIVDGWGELRANACIVSYMNGYSDPRRAKYFTEQTVTGDGGYAGVRSGSAEIPSESIYGNYSRLYIATDNQLPQPVMFAAEAAFLRAEGALKGWNMGGDAKDFYEKGIRLSFAEQGADGVEAYLADGTSKPEGYTDPSSGHSGNDIAAMSSVTVKWNEDDGKSLERVLVQKWIALFPDPLNGWSDFRRTGYPKIFPPVNSENPDCDITRGQRRLRFTQSEYNTNKANVTEAVTMLSNGTDSNGTDLWWALKSNGSY